MSRLGSIFSVLDFLNFGSVLSMRSSARLGSSLSVYGMVRLGSTLSVHGLELFSFFSGSARSLYAERQGSEIVDNCRRSVKRSETSHEKVFGFHEIAYPRLDKKEGRSYRIWQQNTVAREP